MYDEVVGEDVPDDFMSFLEKADERLSGGGNAAQSDSAVQDESDPAKKR